MIRAAIGFFTGGSFTRLAATLLAGAALGATATHQVHRAINAQAQVQRDRATLQAIEAAHRETTRYQEQADAAIEQANTRALANARSAAGARSQLERLRLQLATGAPADAATCPATAQRAATLAAVHGECAGALAELGRQADAHAADALKLYQAWPRPPD